MIDLYFAGSGTKEAADRIRERNCNQLLSQLNERKKVLEWVQYLKDNPQCTSKLFIDSGAFSAHTKGKEVDVDEYIELLNEIDEQVYIFAQVDKIPGEFGKPKTREQLEDAPRESWENYLYMKDRVKSRDKLLPVFHQGEDFKWLENMLEYRHEDGSPIWYIGISPANDVSTTMKAKWLQKVFRTIKYSSNPGVKTHSFGMTSLHLLETFPFTSADSTSWILTGANGSIMTKYGTVTVSDRQLQRPEHIYNKSTQLQNVIRDAVLETGYDLDDLVKDGNKRTLYHVDYLKDWCDSYQFKGLNTYKKSLI